MIQSRTLGAPIGARAVWEPPSVPITSGQTKDKCPACGEQLRSTPSQTWLECPGCGRFAVPPALARLSRQKDSEREAPTRADLNAERRDLAEAKAEACSRLSAWIPVLPPGLAGRLQSYLEDIKHVLSMTEFRKLGEEFNADERLLAARSGTVSQAPSRTLAISAPASADEDDGYDDDQEEDDDVPGGDRPHLSLTEVTRELLGSIASPAAISYARPRAVRCGKCSRPAIMEADYNGGFTWRLCEEHARWMRACPGVSFEVRQWYGLPPADWSGGAA